MKNKILGLDGIRGIAVGTVILAHTGMYSRFINNGWLTDRTQVLLFGGTGVYIFFVLSGFLITTLLVREYEANGSISVRNFYIRRVYRIFPLYFLVVGLTALFTLFGLAGIPREAFYYALTYTYNFVPREYYSGLLGHTWSLGVEEHFYLIWPVLFSLFFGYRTRTLVLGSVVVIFVFHYLQDHVLPPLSVYYYINRWTITAGAPILMGVVTALALESGRYKGVVRKFMAARVTLFFGCIAFFHTAIFGISSYAMRMNVMACGAALIIAWVSLNQRGTLVKALEFRPLRYIGIISYGLYMWQGFFLGTGPRRIAGVEWPPSPLAGFILLCIVAPLSYHCFEKPILQMKHKYVPKRKVV